VGVLGQRGRADEGREGLEFDCMDPWVCGQPSREAERDMRYEIRDSRFEIRDTRWSARC
jgi:hypothetical protein